MITITKRALFALLLGALFVTAARAQGTYTAASCNFNDVNACINSGSGTCTPSTHTAVNGDIINIPSGSCTWTSGLTVPSGIGVAILGNGTPNSTSSTTGASSSCSSGTTITLTGGITAFHATPTYGNATMRLSCMNMTYGSGADIAFIVQGTCTSAGCPNLRVDNITFSNWAGHANAGISYGISAVGDMFGVIDHNTVTGSAGNYLQLVEQSNASYLGVGSYGDNSWAQPEAYGSANFLFFENNLLTYAGTTENEGSTGSQTHQGGGRIVVRHNTFNTDSMNFEMGWHGTESNGRPRSTRTYEFYENAINCPASTECQAVVATRGGTGIVWGNAVDFSSSAGMMTFLNLETYRTQGSIGGWGACDGSAPYDTNDGTTYWSGTIGSVSGSGPFVVTVSGTSPGWSTNVWSPNGAPYSAHDVTQATGTEITANTANTLTLAYTGGPGAWTPAAGDSIQILRATACIDQGGGRGAGYLYSGSTPQSTPASEVPSPVYAWMNTFSGASLGLSVVYADTARVIQNREYYTENANQSAQTSTTSPFNGSTTIGMGHGTLADRPTSCTPSSNGGTVGVAYWETDNNQLDFCIATNTWSTTTSSPASYTPYAYPHPLSQIPAPPTNVQAVPH